MKIVTIPHPLLTQKTKPVPAVDKRIKNIVKEMEQTLEKQKDPEGVGLSAPQVELDMQLFIVKHPKKKKLYTFINPVIEKTEMFQRDPNEEDDGNLEGCLSIPDIWAPVDRFDRVFVTYTELDGSKQSKWFEGFMSIVVQHEVDHLEGILFTQRALEQGKPIYREVNGKLREIDLLKNGV